MNPFFLFNKMFLMNRSFLWLLFWINFLGTIYGYIWYGGQLAYTAITEPLWLLVFVPDSPTASLFFTITILFLLYPPSTRYKWITVVRQIVEGLAVVCSVKYGVWAVAIIFAGWFEGAPMYATDFMLIASHLGMAIEVLLYLRFMSVGKAGLLLATGWLLLNDTIDYTYGVYPNLPTQLHDNVSTVKWFTVTLSIISLFISLFVFKFKKRS
ncbi:DUF1405 domain-containing protein [Paenibacillus yanchengensis]|uniref:DUF1405 domain-containing protein n=1 Tax=Paenibacillus yanchengensis TaxID=2035833 RepID=A0ABW4YJS8_9BACL